MNQFSREVYLFSELSFPKRKLHALEADHDAAQVKKVQERYNYTKSLKHSGLYKKTALKRRNKIMNLQ